jgi:hypothetical protein
MHTCVIAHLNVSSRGACLNLYVCMCVRARVCVRVCLGHMIHPSHGSRGQTDNCVSDMVYTAI